MHNGAILERIISVKKDLNSDYKTTTTNILDAFDFLHFSAQRLAILTQKLEFLSRHSCVNQSELEELVKVRANLPRE